MPRSIVLMPLGRVERKVLDILAGRLPKKLTWAAVHIGPTIEENELETCYDPYRKQYNSTRILEVLHDRAMSIKAYRALGVAEFDLYADNLNFVFGEAIYAGSAAVISTYRLRANNEHVFAARLIKEAVHELGHTMALKHCPNPLCVMFFSNSIYDTDIKGEDYCAKCLGRLSY